MSDPLWMPGVPRVEPTGQAPIPLGLQGKGLRLFTWHTFEAPYTYSPDCVAAARYLNTQRSTSHFVFHPVTGALVQLLPMNVGARTLRANGPSQHTNAFGDVHAQVEVIAYANRPFTLDLTPAGKATLARLMAFLREWGIPDQWAFTSPPPTYPGPGVTRGIPTRSGHAYHAGWWANDHGDPGAIAAPWTLVPDQEAPPTMPGLHPFPAANRIGTDGFWRDLEALFNQAGYAVYCGPSYVRRGWCAPGKHPHGRNSRHFAARALDLGHDPASGAAVSPWEGAVLDATSRMLRARYPRMGMVWNRGPGDHQDHLHADDQNYGTEGRPTGHTIPGLTLFGQIGADVGTLQTNLRRAGHPITVDNIFGLGTYDALRLFQHVNGLIPDGMSGDATRAALPTYRLQAAINTYGHQLVVDGIDGPATQSAARQAATLAGYAGDLHDHARLATHLEDTMSEILSELRTLREGVADNKRRLSQLQNAPKPPTAKEIVDALMSRVLYGFPFHWWVRRGGILDPDHRHFPADPGSPADKELRAEAAESGRATVYGPDGTAVLLELDEHGRFQIKED